MSRLRVNLNRDWRFVREDRPAAQAPGYDDSAWQSINLPHSFDLPYFRTPEFYVGFGWYRKILQIDSAWRTRRLFLEFDGVFQEAEIFLNGIVVGGHRGGYIGFSSVVADAGRPGAHLMAVP